MSTAFDPQLALTPLLPSPLESVDDERFAQQGVQLLLKRDDRIHPQLPGNKWRKLVPNLRAAQQAGQGTLLTFGGAYSNHLRATAAAGRLLGLETIGVVRGDELADRPLNPSLAGCAADGMRLHFVDRPSYRRRAEPALLDELRERFGDFFAVPEGGSNAAAVRGCVELGRELRGRADVVGVACGTGGTLAGLAAGLTAGPHQPQPAADDSPGRGAHRPEDPARATNSTPRAIGFPVLRGGFLSGEVRRLQREAFGGERGSWALDDRFHCGGFARTTEQLDAFAEDFAARHGLPRVERTYVAKLLYGLTTLATEGAFAPGSTVAAVITA